jgi:hypothetical protein
MHHKLIENKNAINIVIKNNVGKTYSHHKKHKRENLYETHSSIPNAIAPTYVNRFVDIPNPKISNSYELNEPRIRNEAPISTSAGSDSFHKIGDTTPRDVYDDGNILFSPNYQDYVNALQKKQMPNNFVNEEDDLKAHLRPYAILPPTNKSGGGVSTDDETEQEVKIFRKPKRTPEQLAVDKQHQILIKREKDIEKANNKIIKLKSQVEEARKKYLEYNSKLGQARRTEQAKDAWLNIQESLQVAEDRLKLLENDKK